MLASKLGGSSLPARGLLAVALALATSCGGDSTQGSAEGSTEGAGGTEGGETANAGNGGTANGGEGDNWDGDTAGGNGGTNGGSAAAGGESPWGAPEAESGRPLPPRRPMSGSARSSYQQGVEAAQRGDNDAATAAFTRALNEDGNAYKAAYNLGVIAQRAGQDNRALEFYRRSLSIQADYERAAEGIVSVHIQRGNVSEALAFIEPLARQWERNLHLQAIYAEVLVQADRGDDAITAARAALRRDERFVPAMIAIIKASLKRGRTELATSVLEQATAVDGDNAELHYLHGQMLIGEEGRLRDAISEFERAVALRPDYVEARMALGIQLLSGANYDQALTHLEAASRLAPNLVAAQLNVGDAYRAKKMWTKAKDAFDRALRMQSNLPQAHFNLGLLYLGAGADFPEQDLLTSLRKAVEEFTAYRNAMGSRLPRNDVSTGYLEDIQRRIEREQKRIERDRAKQARDAERAARPAADGGTQ